MTSPPMARLVVCMRKICKNSCSAPYQAFTAYSDDVRHTTFSEKGVRLAQKMPVGPCIPVGIQPSKAEVGPTSGPTWRRAHFLAGGDVAEQPVRDVVRVQRLVCGLQ